MNSASQITLARDCLRRWAFERSDPLPKPPEMMAAAAEGTALHAIGQNYHDKGLAPDLDTKLGRLFAAALPFVPRPGAGRAEGEFAAVVSKREYLGFIDLECRVGDVPNVPFDADPTTPCVVDYKGKTTIRTGERSNILEGPGDFLDDPQALIYAVRTLVKHNAPQVMLRWIYMQREGKPRVVPSDALLSREEVAGAFGRIVHPLAVRLDDLRPKLHLPTFSALDLPPSPHSCRKYGPKYACPYEGRCNLSASDLLAAMDDTETQGDVNMAEDLLAKLQAKAAPKAAPVTEVKGINPPRPEAAAKAAEAPKAEAPKAEAVASDAELGRALRTLIKAWRGA